jgi:transposase-like protein
LPVRIEASRSAIEREYALARRHLSAADSQWAYFRRDLRIYTGASTYFFKPFERMHWTRTQAMLDAAEYLAEMVVAETEQGQTLA